MTSELEANIVAVERTKEYAEEPNEVWFLFCCHSSYNLFLLGEENQK